MPDGACLHRPAAPSPSRHNIAQVPVKSIATSLYLQPSQLRRVNREFVRYVRANFPIRFYRSDPLWAVYWAAALLRMCDTVESMMALLTRGKDEDTEILLRSLYEQAVVLAWVAIDPPVRHKQWKGESDKQLLTLHNEVVPYGYGFLSPVEVAECDAATGIPSTETMAREADAHWPGKIRGLQSRGHFLSFHGMYQGVYRVGSRPAHGSIAALEAYARQSGSRIVVEVPVRQPAMLRYSLAAPLLGMALVVASEQFRWIDETRVRRFVDRATAATARRRGAT